MGKKHLYQITDIKWDTDEDNVDLPTNVTIEIDDNGMSNEEVEETISDRLSDDYGFCHFGFYYEKVGA